MVSEINNGADSSAGEAYDDLRMICADVMQHIGVALTHGVQALECAEDGDDPTSEWEDANTNLDRAAACLITAQERCVRAAAESKEAA